MAENNISWANYGTYHIADNPTVYQPVRQNNFRFIVNFSENPNLSSGLTRAGVDTEQGDNNGLITNGVEALDFSVVKFDAPHFEQEEIKINRGNSVVYYASTPTFKEGSLVINDFAGADGKSVLMAWQALSYDVINDRIASSDKYKVDAKVLEYLPDGTLLRYWDLKGCWVKGLSEDSWDASSGEKKTVTASIRYDRAIPHLEYSGNDGKKF